MTTTVAGQSNRKSHRIGQQRPVQEAPWMPAKGLVVKAKLIATSEQWEVSANPQPGKLPFPFKWLTFHLFTADDQGNLEPVINETKGKVYEMRRVMSLAPGALGMLVQYAFATGRGVREPQYDFGTYDYEKPEDPGLREQMAEVDGLLHWQLEEGVLMNAEVKHTKDNRANAPSPYQAELKWRDPDGFDPEAAAEQSEAQELVDYVVQQAQQAASDDLPDATPHAKPADEAQPAPTEEPSEEPTAERAQSARTRGRSGRR